MPDSSVFQTDLVNAATGAINSAKKGGLFLRLIRAAQPITRNEIADRLKIDKNAITENVKPLMSNGVLLKETLKSDSANGVGCTQLFAKLYSDD